MDRETRVRLVRVLRASQTRQIAGTLMLKGVLAAVDESGDAQGDDYEGAEGGRLRDEVVDALVTGNNHVQALEHIIARLEAPL